MTKKQLVRDCLTELGVHAPFGDAKKWFLKNHKLKLADATFYHVRKTMQLEKLTSAAKVSAVPQQKLNVVGVVKTVRELVAKFGKEEVKQLVDLL